MVLTIIDHQGNENQNHSEESPYTCQNDLSLKRQGLKSIGKDWKKRTLMESSMEVPQKIELSYDPAIRLLGISFKK